MPPQENWDKEGDRTGKIRLVARSEMEGVQSDVKAVKKLQLWGGIALGVLGLGFAAAVFLFSRFAATDVVNKLSDKQEEVTKQFTDHVAAESSRMGRVEERGKNLEEDFHWQRDQLSRIAERVGARRVPAPKHEKENHDE